MTVLGPDVLNFDMDAEVEHTSSRLREILRKDLNRRGLVVAMSGGIDVAAGSVQIATEVIEGANVWMTRRDPEKISQGINRIAEEIKAQLGSNQAKLVLHFDCAGRGKMIFRDPQKLQLLRTLREQIGSDTPWLGLYTYAEIGPIQEHNNLHNYTAVITAIY